MDIKINKKELDALLVITSIKPKLKYVFKSNDKLFISERKPFYKNGEYYSNKCGYRFEFTSLEEKGYDFSFLNKLTEAINVDELKING